MFAVAMLFTLHGISKQLAYKAQDGETKNVGTSVNAWKMSIAYCGDAADGAQLGGLFVPMQPMQYLPKKSGAIHARTGH